MTQEEIDIIKYGDFYEEIAELRKLRGEIESLRKLRDTVMRCREWYGVSQQLAERDNQIESLKASLYGHYELEKEVETAWAQAHRLALELECLIMDTKDNTTVSKWWDSAFEAMEEYHNLKPGTAKDAEVWAKMRKAKI